MTSKNQDEALNRIRAISMIENFPIEKVESLHSKILDNKNLYDPEVLSHINPLFWVHGLDSIEESDFKDNEKEEWDDDLPF